MMISMGWCVTRDRIFNERSLLRLFRGPVAVTEGSPSSEAEL